MTNYQKTEYYYTRTKNCFVNNDNVEELFLFAGLTRIKYQMFSNIKRKQTIPVISELLEIPCSQACEEYLSLPDETVIYQLEEDEFTSLLFLSKENRITFFLYQPKNEKGKKPLP